jgi:hypothetical protein
MQASMLLYADSGSGGKGCPDGMALINVPRQKPWWFVFNTSSSWAVNLCRYPTPSSWNTLDGMGVSR